MDSLHDYEGTMDQAIKGVRKGMSELVNYRYTATWNGPWRGGNILVCIRDEDDESGGQRLDAQIAKYAPGEDAPQAQAQRAAPAGKVVCPKHGAEMTFEAEGKYGPYYWHKDGEKSCYGRKDCPVHQYSELRMKAWDGGTISWSHETDDTRFPENKKGKRYCPGHLPGEAPEQATIQPVEDEIPF